MRAIHLQPNETRTGFRANSDYTKALLQDWMRQYDNFEVKPVAHESMRGRRYLEGALIPEYCYWQYGIHPQEKGKSEQRRTLFMRDFNSEIVKNRDGLPVKVPQSSKGKVSDITQTYCDWAVENGAPIPNPELFKLYRDQYSMDVRWDNFHDWLAFLDIECDAMPTAQTLEILNL